MKTVIILFTLLLSGLAYSQNRYILEGFESIGLTQKATPIEVCRAIPSGSIWYAYIENGKPMAWSGYHNFKGTVIGLKISASKCFLYRMEDHLNLSGWNGNLSATSIYVAQYSEDSNSTNGFQFTGFEPVNGRSQSKKRNDGWAAMELVRVCESYLGHYWQYDNKQHEDVMRHIQDGNLFVPNGLFTQDNIESYKKKYRHGVYERNDFPVIDCQTLIKLAISGIPYEYSPYVDKSYLFKGLNAYSWSMQPYNVWLHDLMEWCLSSGYEIAPGPNFENLQAGDLVFYAAGSGDNQKSRRVCHVAMFTGRWVTDKGLQPKSVSQKVYPTIYSFPLYNSSGSLIGYDTLKLHPQTIEVNPAPDDYPNTCVVRHSFLDYPLKKGNRRDQIVMYARLPLNTKGSWQNRNPWNNPTNLIHTSWFSTEYKIRVVGNGSPFSLYISSLNQSGSLVEQSGHVITNYMPYNKKAHEILPKKARLKKVEYFDAMFKPLTDSISASYVRKVFQDINLETMKAEYFYNGVNQYKVFSKAETPILIFGYLKDGEVAMIDTKTESYITSMGSELKVICNHNSSPGMKVVFCPNNQETIVSWE